MPVSDQYRRQAALLVRALPLVAAETCFALKGGSAINLFVRDMPRLSVDIDLTYLPVEDRATSLANIDAAMQRLDKRIREGLRGARVTSTRLQPDDIVTKIFVEADDVQIKIEATPVLRGCVYDPKVRSVSAAVEAQFGFAEIQVVSFADLYAGKLVAALDRQHPRDLFDVRDLLANEGIDDEVRKAFVVYVLSHNRPMAEVLAFMRFQMRDDIWSCGRIQSRKSYLLLFRFEPEYLTRSVPSLLLYFESDSSKNGWPNAKELQQRNIWEISRP